jgi:hypothetical protein
MLAAGASSSQNQVMARALRRNAVVAAFAAGVFLVVFFVFLNHHNRVTCHGCGQPPTVLVAKVSIAKGTSGSVIAAQGLYSARRVRLNQVANGALVDPSAFRGEVATRAIAPGAQLTAADFALPGPIYYPRGYPKVVSASQTPHEMSDYLGPPSFSSDLALAPGVWVDGSPSQAAIDKHVANGTLIGYCRSVRAFQAHNPDIPFATKCWRARPSSPQTGTSS